MSFRTTLLVTIILSLLVAGLFQFRRHLPGFTYVPPGQVMVVTEKDNKFSFEFPRFWEEGPTTCFTGGFHNTYFYDKRMRIIWEGQSFFLEGTPCESRVEVIFQIDPTKAMEIHTQFQGPENLNRELLWKIQLLAHMLPANLTIEECLQTVSRGKELCFPDPEVIKAFVKNLEEILPTGIQVIYTSIRGFEPPQHLLDLLEQKEKAELELRQAEKDLLQAEQHLRDISEPLRE